jgi:hypothetical protein
MRIKLEASIAQERKKKHQVNMEWLAADSHQREDHEAYCVVRAEYPGTCQWILKHEVLDQWRKTDMPATPLLWIKGIPGAGKSLELYHCLHKTLQRIRENYSYFRHYRGMSK